MNKIENETHHRQMRNELLLVVIPRPMNSPSVKQTAILTPIFQRVRKSPGSTDGTRLDRDLKLHFSW